MDNQDERRANGRRVNDDFNVRITLLEKAVLMLEDEIKEQSAHGVLVCNKLDEIRLELSSGRGFLKAVVLGCAFLVALFSALMAIQWLKIPS